MVFSVNTLNESINKPFHKEVEKENDNFSFFESSLTLLITEQREFEYNMIQLSEGLVSKVVMNKVSNKIFSNTRYTIRNIIFIINGISYRTST